MVVKGARKSTVQQTRRVMYSVISSKLKTVKEANGFQYEMYWYPISLWISSSVYILNRAERELVISEERSEAAVYRVKQD